MAVLVACAACGRLPSAAPPNLPEIPLSGLSSTVRGQVEKARSAALANVRSAAAAGELGMVLHAYEQYAPAIVCYQRAAALDSRSHRWQYLLGSTLGSAGQREASILSLTEAAKLDPNYLAGQLALAAQMTAAGRNDDAIELAEKCVRRAPESAQAHFVLGKARSAVRDTNGAAAEYRLACERVPAFAAARYALGMAERELGRAEEAAKQLQLHSRYRTLRPHTEDPLLEEVRQLDISAPGAAKRAVWMINEGRLFDAIAEFEKAIRADPNYQPAYAGIVALYNRLRMISAADVFYAGAAAQHPEFYDMHMNYAILKFEGGNLGEAERVLRRILTHDPVHTEANVQMGRLMEKRGRAAAAETHYRLALERQENHVQANYLLARRLTDTGRVDRAIPLMVAAVSQATDDRAGWYRRALAGIYARAGRRADAIEAAEKALETARVWKQADLEKALQSDLRILNAGGTPK